MINTFEIFYDGIDEYGSIQFCASTKEEAILLFNNWCIIDNKLDEPCSILSMESVYNEEDKIFYDKLYKYS